MLFVCAAAGLILGRNHFEVRVLAMIAIVAAVGLGQSARSGRADGINENALAAPVTPHYWCVGAVLGTLTAVSYYALVRDAEGGYHGVVPVYAFAVTGLAFAVWLGTLAARYSR